MSRLPVIPKKQFEVKSKYIPQGKLSLIPFTVGLETLLIQVKDSTDPEEQALAIKQIVEACIQTKGVDVDALPLFVMEEVFIRLRQNSVGEIIDQSYQCTNEIGEDKKPCNTVMPIQIDLRDFKVKETEGHTDTIVISDSIGVKFNYPSMGSVANAQGASDTDMVVACIQSIFDSENVYKAEDSTKEELIDFWEQLTLLQKKDVFEKFFQSVPKIHYKKDLVCKSCNHKHEVEFNSIQEVFQ